MNKDIINRMNQSVKKCLKDFTQQQLDSSTQILRFIIQEASFNQKCGSFGHGKNSCSPYIEFQIFGEKKKTQVRKKAGLQEVSFLSHFDFKYEQVVNNIDKTFKFKAMEQKILGKDIILGRSANHSIQHLLSILQKEPIHLPPIFVYNETNYRNTGHITVLVEYLRILNEDLDKNKDEQTILEAPNLIQIPDIKPIKKTWNQITNRINQIDLSPKLIQLAQTKFYSQVAQIQMEKAIQFLYEIVEIVDGSEAKDELTEQQARSYFQNTDEQTVNQFQFLKALESWVKIKDNFNQNI